MCDEEQGGGTLKRCTLRTRGRYTEECGFVFLLSICYSTPSSSVLPPDWLASQLATWLASVCITASLAYLIGGASRLVLSLDASWVR